MNTLDSDRIDPRVQDLAGFADEADRTGQFGLPEAFAPWTAAMRQVRECGAPPDVVGALEDASALLHTALYRRGVRVGAAGRAFLAAIDAPDPK